MKPTHLIILVFVLGIPLLAAAEGKFWVFIKSKEVNSTSSTHLVSEKTMQNRFLLQLNESQVSDLPPSTLTLNKIKETGIKVCHISKWLNAVSVWATKDQLETIKKIPDVIGIARIGQWYTARQKTDSLEINKYSETLLQIQGQLLNELGYNGSGITIGVTDAGFYEANKSFYLNHVYERKGIKANRDFVNRERKDVYESNGSSDDHGVEVLSYLGGYHPEKKGVTGLAWGADFVLARTDHQVKESRVDEDNWVAALEWIDSLGVRLVNTSLGYGLGFDKSEENYLPEQIDGKYSVVAKAANIAVKEKGMIMVIAAGNDGGKTNWRIVSTPGDVQGVLTIGATNYTDWNKMNYSGKGPITLPYIKPDVSSASLGGTSFSAPVICGFVACLLQWKPALTSDSLFSIVRRSGHLWPYPNNYLGFGVPQAESVIKYFKTGKWDNKKSEQVRAKGTAVGINIPEEWEVKNIGVFHKSDDRIVIRQSSYPVINNRIVVQKPEGASRSTIHHAKGLWEIFWDN